MRWNLGLQEVSYVLPKSFLYVFFLGEGTIIHRVICSGVLGLGKLTVIVSLGSEMKGWKFDHRMEKHAVF